MSGFVLENEKEIGALNYDGFINWIVSRDLCFCIKQTKWIIFFNQFIYIICWFRFVQHRCNECNVVTQNRVQYTVSRTFLVDNPNCWVYLFLSFIFVCNYDYENQIFTTYNNSHLSQIIMNNCVWVSQLISSWKALKERSSRLKWSNEN